MRLFVYVLKAEGLRRPSEAYVKLKVGKHKSRTRAVKGEPDPVWNEEFVFRMEDEWGGDGDGDEEEEPALSVRVFNKEESGGGIFGGGPGKLLGQVDVSLSGLFGDSRQTLPPTWFPLRGRRDLKSKAVDCGKILLTASMCGRRKYNSAIIHPLAQARHVNNTSPEESSMQHCAPQLIHNSANAHMKPNMDDPMVTPDEKRPIQNLAGQFVQKLLHRKEGSCMFIPRSCDSSESTEDTDVDAEHGNDANVICSTVTFEKAVEIMQSRDKRELPENLQAGILLEQRYIITSKDLNLLLFRPNSPFRREIAELQGTTDYEEGPWMWRHGATPSLTRVVTYIRAATRLVKAVKATEEQTYLKADGKEFVILARVSTPDAPYGNYFHVNLMYSIVPGQLLSSGEQSSLLTVSWDINFSQSTLMKNVIAGGVRQGLEENFKQFADLLSRRVKIVDSTQLLLEKNKILAPLQLQHHSDWQLAVDYYWNFTFLITVVAALFVFLHILLSGPRTTKGLEVCFLDLPDTCGELITSGVLFYLGQRVFHMISHFIKARLQRGNDHGVKAQGDGWLITVALLEGNNLPSGRLTGFSGPYVVFTCNGKTRTSSVQLQTIDPQWNEILEFDAMQEPPSILDVEVFDFDGPFGLASSLGHAEINFLKHAPAELADMWVTLEGTIAKVSQSRLHLKIFLRSTKGSETIKEYLTKMEKEVGKKLSLQSPEKNLMFQKLFGLPQEEFLVKDFSCYLRRFVPVQGRLFLSARIVGFYSNVLGYKMKFFFLWDDIEDIQEIPPSVATFGSHSLLITLRKDRGLDARHGAKSLDEEGRLRFQFQSFPSFSMVSRTIMALWRTKAIKSEKKFEVEEDTDQDENSAQVQSTRFSVGADECELPKVYSVEVSLHINSLMRVFGGGHMEKKIMEKVGCLSYTSTPWELVKPDLYEREVHYKFNHHVSIFGGEVTSTQKRTPIVDGQGWMVDETMTLHGIPFGSHFRVHLRYQIMSTSLPEVCHCDVFLGVTWLHSTIFRKRITKNICDKLTQRSEEIFHIAGSEIMPREEVA
ncbi:hypothetical protein Taro_026025 [Colocasia esculenta]|uniref:C2 and GRAM domain-containing protein n=1 Tax=Colocasia esculenta TaxID=4460 RepID=A0A843VJE1_COLES|nr:hypothetical protein [Colocasia esculenta]